MATTDTSAELLSVYQIALIEELGFSHDEAKQLYAARTSTTLRDKAGFLRRYEQKVDHHIIRKLMDAGASKEQVLAILL